MMIKRHLLIAVQLGEKQNRTQSPLTLVITALTWLMNEERYTRERKKARPRNEEKGDTGRAWLLAKARPYYSMKQYII